MTVREALGGPWAAHWFVWVVLFPPTTLIVLLREIATPFPEWWWPLVSAVLQHLATGVVIFGGAAIARRRWTILPLWCVSILWAAAAAARGVVAGALAQSVAGVDGEYLSRVVVWVVASSLWIPPFVYTFAQFDRRRLLMGAIETLTDELREHHTTAQASGREIRATLSSAVRNSLGPALAELQSSLEANRQSLDSGTVAELSMRIAQVHDDAADLLESAAAPASRPEARASLLRASEIEPRQPWSNAGLVAAATLALLVPDVARVFGQPAVIEVVVATLVGAALLGFIPWLWSSRTLRVTSDRPQRPTVVASVAAMAAATYIMLNSGIDDVTWHGLVILPALSTCIVLASAVFVGAIVLADANVEAEASIAAVGADLERARRQHDELVDLERQRLADLMHGPVQGRLAACVMALNFHASGDHTDEQARFLTDSVLDHLRAVSRDLLTITEAESDPEAEPEAADERRGTPPNGGLEQR